MPGSSENICLELSAHQMPDSGWQPGLTSNVQLFLKNTSPLPVSISRGDYTFFVDGEPTCFSGSFPGLVHIRPNEETAQEHCPVDFPADLAENVNGGILSLQIITYGTTPESTISGSCTMDVAISNIPGPFRCAAGKNVALELSEKQFDSISNIDAILAFLDEAYNSMAELTGQRPMNGIKMVLREVPSFFAFARAGFPILLNSIHVRNSIEWFDKGSICFAWLHEMGHNFEYGFWYMYNSPSCEFHANFKLAYAIEHCMANTREFFLLPWEKDPDPNARFETGRDWVASKFLNIDIDYFENSERDWLSLSSDELMLFYLRLVRQHGWAPFKKMYRVYRALSADIDARPTENSGKEMFSLQMAVLSHCIDHDIATYCAEWRMPVTNDDISTITKKYDLPRCIPSADEGC